MADSAPIRCILLTGATSHTGRRVARRILEKGYRLRCLLHSQANRHRIPEHENLEIVMGSADNEADIAQAAEGVDAVVNIAHIKYAPTLLRALERRSAPIRLIVMSSTRGLSSFDTPVREIVRQGEAIVRAAAPHIHWTIIRPSMIFGGPSDNNLERMAGFLRRWRIAPVVGAGKNLWQPVFVWDLVDAISATLERPETAGRDYTIAGGEAIAYRDVVCRVARAAGIGSPFLLCIPRKPALVLAAVWQRLRPRSRLRETIERFGEDRVFDIEAARRDLGFVPTPFDEALARKFRREV